MKISAEISLISKVKLAVLRKKTKRMIAERSRR